jgi:hypothetical protein
MDLDNPNSTPARLTHSSGFLFVWTASEKVEFGILVLHSAEEANKKSRSAQGLRAKQLLELLRPA